MNGDQRENGKKEAGNAEEKKVKRPQKGARKSRGRKKGKGAAVIFLLILVIAAVAALIALYVQYSKPSEKKLSHQEYFGLEADDQYGLIFNQDVIEGVPVLEDGYWYLSFSTMYYNICNVFYYDGFSLLYTDPVQTYSTKPGEYSYTSEDGTVYKLDYRPCYFADGGMYIALEYLQLMDFSYYVADEQLRSVWIFNDWSEVTQATVSQAAELRQEASVKKPIVGQVSAGEQVTLLEQGEKWSRVQTASGWIGWLQQDKLQDISNQARAVPDGRPLPEYTNISVDGKIAMGWHQVFTTSGYDALDDILETAKGMNVICPTWFTISDDSGNIRNLGEKKYVAKAQKAGLQVWVMLENINIAVDELQIFGTTENRKNLIDNVIRAAGDLGVDGINVDIENLKEDVAPSYLQFLRELGAACRNEQLVLSTDNYSPMPHTAFYDRRQQGEILDYVIVMAYDEHWQGGEEAGTTSSLSFVDQSAKRTIEQVPREKVIVGLPFYSRIWCEAPADEGEEGAVTVDNTSGEYDSRYDRYALSSKGVGMDGMKSFIKEHALSLTWNDETGQYYTEYEEDGKYYRLWVEDARSMDMKMQTAMSYDPAGVAFFKVGNEDKETWTVIRKYIQ